MKRLGRFLWIPFLLVTCLSCTSGPVVEQKRLIVGIVSYGEGQRSLEQYADFKTYLEQSLKSIVELEPALNEVQAVQQVERQSWDLVFAPPGLAAIAISQARYLPLFPREGGNAQRSVIVVQQDSAPQQLSDLAQQVIALGQEGSATGFYFPIYNLYGLTLKQVRLAPTPKQTLEWVASGEVTAGALSLAELERFRSDFGTATFRVLHRDVHPVPSGALLVGPTVERNFQAQIRQVLEEIPSEVASAAGFVSNAPPPDYTYLIQVVKQVRPIAQRIKEQPAPLY